MESVRKNGYIWAAAAVLCAVIAFFSIAAIAYAGQASIGESGVGVSSEQAANPKEKSERVTVHAAADGSIKDIQVEATLKNPQEHNALNDISYLKEIATDDDIPYASDGSTLIWEAKGDSVVYTGTSHETLPISMRISYMLDGEKIEPGELVGKSGHVEISFEFDNLSSHLMNIQGSPRKVFTPFTVVTGVLLDDDTFSNVSVDNGRIIEDEGRLIVMGYAMPGLAESLDLASLGKDIDVPESFTISADVNSFEMGSTLTLATTDIFKDVDTSKLGLGDYSDATSALESAISQLEDGSDKLSSGLDELAEGLSKLKESSSQLPSGIDAITQGSTSLSEGLAALTGSQGDTAGSLWALKNAASQTADGTSGVSSGIESAIASLKEMEEALGKIDEALKTANEQLGIVDANTAAALESVGALQTALQTTIGEMQTTLAALNAVDLETLHSNAQSAANAAQTASGDLSTVNVAGVGQASSAIQNALSAMPEDDPQRAALQEALNALSTVDVSGIDAALSDISSAVSYAQQAEAAIAPASEALASLKQTLAQELQALAAAAQSLSDAVEQAKLEETATAFKTAQAYTAGAQTGLEDLQAAIAQAIGTPQDSENSLYALLRASKLVSYGASSVNQGMGMILNIMEGQMVPGAQELEQALRELDANAPALVEGISALSEGADAAAKGSHEFTRGIGVFGSSVRSNLSSMAGGGISQLSDRIDAVSTLAGEYETFSGKPDGVPGSVVFVFETEALES